MLAHQRRHGQSRSAHLWTTTYAEDRSYLATAIFSADDVAHATLQHACRLVIVANN